MFPTRRFELVSPLPPTDIHDRLAPHLAARRANAGLGERPDRPYFGKVALASFEIAPNTVSRNGFIPCAYGHVVPEGRGSRVKVLMQMLPFTRVFMRIWMGVASVVLVVVIAAVVRAIVLERAFGWPVLLPIGIAATFPALGLLAMRLGFGREAPALETFLRSVIEGDGPR